MVPGPFTFVQTLSYPQGKITRGIEVAPAHVKLNPHVPFAVREIGAVGFLDLLRRFGRKSMNLDALTALTYR